MLNFPKEIYTDLLSFLRNPEEQPAEIQTKAEKAKKVLALLIIDLPIMGILVGIISVLEKIGLFDLESIKMTMLFLSIPTGIFVFLMVFLIPFFEELIFRLYLRYKYNYLLRFLVFSSSIAGAKNHEKATAWVSKVWTRGYKLIFYVTAILFGLVHLTNYVTTPVMILFAPFIVAPQFVAGLFLGYLRVRHGIFTGFALHALHNSIFLCIPLLFMGESMNTIEAETKTYTMEIGKSNTLPNASSINYYKDSVIINHTSLKSILSEVLNKDQLLIKSNNEPYMSLFINLKFKKKQFEKTTNNQKADYHFLQNSIRDQLSKSCGFRIINETKIQDIWELCCIDSSLLAKNVSDSINYNRIDFRAGELRTSNTSMYHLAKALSEECHKIIVNKTGTKQKYGMKLQTNDFEALQKQLIAEYGLSLKKSEKEIEYTTIEF
jgi:membrane protease YdiL (CAAX protease family)